MPNDDLISRKALLENYDLKNATKYGNKTEEQRHNSYSTLMRYEIADMIMDAPAVNAEPVRHAQWVTDDLGNTLCSNCKSRIPYYKEYDMDDDYGGEYDIEIAETNYCPNCGAKMYKEE